MSYLGAIKCYKCGREQSVVETEEDEGGITLKEAVFLGWTVETDDKNEKHNLCPLCLPEEN